MNNPIRILTSLLCLIWCFNINSQSLSDELIKFKYKSLYDINAELDFSNSSSINIDFDNINVAGDKSYYFEIKLEYTRQNLTDTELANFNLNVSYTLDVGSILTGSLSLEKSSNEDKYLDLVRGDLTNDVNINLSIENINFVHNLTNEFDLNDFNVILSIVSKSKLELETTAPEITHEASQFNTNQLEFRWDGIQGADRYEFEYVFIDEEEEEFTNLSEDLISQAVRIYTNLPAYKLDLIYPNGTLYYRVRAVGSHIINNESVGLKYGNWSHDFMSTANLDSYVIDDTNQFSEIYNWTFNKDFAEQGKSNVSVTFYDYSLRHRQTKLKLNHEDQFLINESKFDIEGRPSLQILPVPQGLFLGKNFNFIPHFNQVDDVGSPSFSYVNIEKEVPDVLTSTAGKGASYYYSPQNFEFNNIVNNGVLPDANGRPYASTRYTNDNTGRVVAQSTVGEGYHIGSGHETKYFYTTVQQEELNRLFGEEIGDASHYKKTITIDPNGQASGSYSNLAGQVIATCLIGEAPDNVISLSDNIKNTILSIGGDDFGDDNKMESLSQIYIESDSKAISFEYEIEDIVHQFVGGSINICGTCNYNLSVSIADECGEVLAEKIIGPLFGSDLLDTDCSTLNNAPRDQTLDLMFPTVLDKGVYRIHKVLEIVKPDINDIVDMVKQDASYGQSLYNTIFNDVYAELIEDECYPTCYSICYKMALEEGIINAEIDEYISNCMQTVCYDALEGEDGLLAQYSELNCDGAFQSMKEMIIASEDFLSCGSYSSCIINNDIRLFGLDAFGSEFEVRYFNDKFRRYDRNGKYIGLAEIDLINDIDVALNFDFNNDNFSSLPKSYWQESWAESFVNYHIEYCHYENCIELSDVKAFPVTLSRLSTIQEALTYFSPFINTGLSDYENLVNHFTDPNEDRTDPLFNLPNILECSPSEKINKLTSKINNYMSQRYEGTIANVDDFYEYIAYYEMNDFDPTADNPTPWELFSSTYLGFREELISTPLNDGGCYSDMNDCEYQKADEIPYSSHQDFDPIYTRPLLEESFDEEDLEQHLDKVENFEASLASGQLNYIYSKIEHAILPGSSTSVLGIFNTHVLPMILNFCGQPCLAPGPYPGPNSDYPLPELLLPLETNCCQLNTYDVYNAAPSSSECMNLFHRSLTIPTLGTDMTNLNGCEGETVAEELLLKFNGSSLFKNRLVARFNTCPELAKDIKVQIFKASNCTDVNSWEELECTMLSLRHNNLIVEWDLSSNSKSSTGSGPFTIIRFYRSDTDHDAQEPTLPFTIDLYSGYNDLAVDHFQYAHNNNWPFTLQQLSSIISPYMDQTLFNAYDFEEFVLKNAWNCQQDCSEIDGCMIEILDHIVDADFSTIFPINNPNGADLLLPNESTSCIEQIVLEENETNSTYTSFSFRLELGATNPFFLQAENVNLYFINTDGTFIYFDEQTNIIDYNTTFLKFKNLDPYLSENSYIDSGISILYSSVEDGELKYHKGYMLIEAKFGVQQPMSLTCDEIWDIEEYTTDCLKELNTLAIEYTEALYEEQILLVANELLLSIDCKDGLEEVFTATYNTNEYHHTLYYYDRVGNIIKTVPPEGVKEDLLHEKITTYTYNSYNLLNFQNTPDAGDSYFYYDDIQRMRASRNAKQLNEPISRISYTKYDDINRVIEVGEKNWPKTLTPSAKQKNNPLWPTANNTFEITKTYYDDPPPPAMGSVNSDQENLRGRISVTQRLASPNTIESECRYSYDSHGNIKHLKTIIPDLPEVDVFYDYELVSGNVEQVRYNPDEFDEFYHRYEYDANNRLEKTFTSEDGILWDEDARYFYFNHGPLARIELGEDKVQGCDYTYTLQGWIKGVNSPGIDNHLYEPGIDGHPILYGLNSNLNSLVARDGVSYKLGYNSTDYTSIANLGSGPLESIYSTVTNVILEDGLYNGNIVSMSTDLLGLDNIGNEGYILKSYMYDQLHRIKAAYSLSVSNLNGIANFPGPLGSAAYKTTYDYDGDGNLTKLFRRDNQGLIIDDFTYKYENPNRPNQLTHIDDGINSTTYDYDVDDQSPNNYEYDDIGNLLSNEQDNIDNIIWDVYGKVTSITFDDGKETRFTYDASGNRVSKLIFANDGTYQKGTYYLRDASGNVMSIYDRYLTDPNTFALIQKETPIYGSSRLGQKFHNRILGGSSVLSNVSGVEHSSRILNKKIYEISNHLGNVLSTITDKKSGISTTERVEYYEPVFNTVSDYYPFGMEMPDRTYTNTATTNYRYGFNGKEKDEDGEWGDLTHYDYGFRIYNPGIGKFLSVDPLTKSYPWYTPYQFAGNMPILAVDLDGLEPKPRWIVEEGKGYAILVVVNKGQEQRMSGILSKDGISLGVYIHKKPPPGSNFFKLEKQWLTENHSGKYDKSSTIGSVTANSLMKPINSLPGLTSSLLNKERDILKISSSNLSPIEPRYESSGNDPEDLALRPSLIAPGDIRGEGSRVFGFKNLNKTKSDLLEVANYLIANPDQTLHVGAMIYGVQGGARFSSESGYVAEGEYFTDSQYIFKQTGELVKILRDLGVENDIKQDWSRSEFNDDGNSRSNGGKDNGRKDQYLFRVSDSKK